MDINWNTNFEESSPSAGSTLSLIDDYIRDFKYAFRERFDVEHDMDELQRTHGRHRQGSAVAYYTSTEPTSNLAEETLSDDELDNGRLWVDTTDGRRTLKVWNGSAWQRAWNDGNGIYFDDDVVFSQLDDVDHQLHVDSDLYVSDTLKLEDSDAPVRVTGDDVSETHGFKIGDFRYVFKEAYREVVLDDEINMGTQHYTRIGPAFLYVREDSFTFVYNGAARRCSPFGGGYGFFTVYRGSGPGNTYLHCFSPLEAEFHVGYFGDGE